MTDTWNGFVTTIGALSPASYLGLVIVLAVLAQWAAWQIRLPSILLLLIIGFGLGRLVDPEQVWGSSASIGVRNSPGAGT